MKIKSIVPKINLKQIVTENGAYNIALLINEKVQYEAEKVKVFKNGKGNIMKGDKRCGNRTHFDKHDGSTYFYLYDNDELVLRTSAVQAIYKL